MSEVAGSRRRRSIHVVTTAGSGLGRGHLSRALTLAEAIVRQDGRVSLELTAGRLEGAAAARAGRIGVELVAEAPLDAIVVIDLPVPEDAAARGPSERRVVFDDGDAFGGKAAIVVQPSMPVWRGSGSAGRILAGYEFAPVARDYLELRAIAPPERSSQRIEVIVCFGGSDPWLVTPRVATVLSAQDGWRTTTVVGPDYGGGLEELGPGALRDPADLPARLARADLAVIGAGTMKFEVASLRRAAVLLAVADDQLSTGPPFASTGAADYLGDGRTIEPGRVVEAVRGLVEDGERRAAMGRAAAAVVDGLGAERVAAAILALA
jgi:spore coat polysaccharide biosynthesis predicted glycosyltransferase SpsG